jgi:hypothetical protein
MQNRNFKTCGTSFRLESRLEVFTAGGRAATLTRRFELKSLSLRQAGKVFFFNWHVIEGEDTGHA